jgi:hypothetical protein
MIINPLLGLKVLALIGSACIGRAFSGRIGLCALATVKNRESAH